MNRPAGPAATSWVIDLPLPPKMTMNQSRGRQHWAQQNTNTRTVRTDAQRLARHHRIPSVQQITVTAEPLQPKGQTADVGAHMPAVKAAIDGLVDAGVIPDDTPTHLPWVKLCAPRRTPDVDSPTLRLTIEVAP